MPNSCTTKQIKKLCDTFKKETLMELDDYYNPAFILWLQENNPLQSDNVNKEFTVIQKKDFASAIMDAYISAMNEISKKLNAVDRQNDYTKNEVIDLVYEGFAIAKTAGENNMSFLRQIK